MIHPARAFLSGLALATALTVSAQTTAPAPAAEAASTSWTLTPAFVSQYMFRGVRLGGLSFQPAIEYGSGPVVAGIWSSFPIQDKVVGQSDPEIDLYASYTTPVFENLSYTIGFTYYTYPSAKKEDGFYKDTLEPSVALNYTVAGFKVTPKLYYDVVLSGPTAEISGAYTVPLANMGTQLDLAAVIGTFKWDDAINNANPRTKNWGNYWQIGFTMPFQVTKTSKLSLGWAYVNGTGNYIKQGSSPKSGNSAAVGRGVVSLSYAISF